MGGFKIRTEFKLTRRENKNAPNFELLYEPAVTKFHKLAH